MIKIKVSEDGLMGKPVNPYQLEVPTYDRFGKVDGGYIDDDYIKFNETNPLLPLTSKQQPGAVIEVEEVWQYAKFDEWVTYDKYNLLVNSFMELREAYYNSVIRQAYQPIGLLTYADKIREATKNAKSPYVVMVSLDRVVEVVGWLLGHDNFPERQENEGTYYWRTHLRNKLKECGLEQVLTELKSIDHG